MKRIWIGAMVILIVLILSISIYWYYDSQKVKLSVLNFLENQMEFCSVVNDKIWFGKGELWMKCNGRPFYAIYSNGNVSYELNGWGFLKQTPSLWNDLNNCDFYDSRNSELIFYCPKNFDSENLIAKIYSLDSNSMRITKINETDFINILFDDMKSAYKNLSTCQLSNKVLSREGSLNIIDMTFDCEGNSYTSEIGFLSTKGMVSLMPPIANYGNDYVKRAIISFEAMFPCSVTSSFLSNITLVNLTGVEINSVCEARKFKVTYFFGEKPFLAYEIERKDRSIDEMRYILSVFGKYLIIPKLSEIKNISFSGLSTYQPMEKYIVDNSKLFVIGQKTVITGLIRVSEGFYVSS
jgi:hypothetical protein